MIFHREAENVVVEEKYPEDMFSVVEKKVFDKILAFVPLPYSPLRGRVVVSQSRRVLFTLFLFCTELRTFPLSTLLPLSLMALL